MAYSPGDVLARAVMHNVTGLPQDDVINDFAFAYDLDIGEVGMLNLVQAIDDFYNVADAGTPGAVAVGTYISEAINRAATHEIVFYRIQAGALGSPLLTVPWLGPDTPLATSNLPAEVAAVASFHATLMGTNEEVGNTRPRARRRGRVYIGPLTISAGDLASSNPRLTAEFTAALRFAMAELRDATVLGTQGWGVWSRADQVVRTVSGGWTDDAFDTQRRRGVAPAVRASWGNP